MANLVFASDLRNPESDRVTWYIVGASMVGGTRGYGDKRRWNYNIADSYPERRLIHHDQLNTDQNLYDRPHDGGAKRVAIREWVTRCCTSDVIHDYIDLSYHYVACAGSWNDSGRRNVAHGYHTFYFQNTDEAAAFSFAFADIISHSILDLHPDYDWIPSDLIKNGRC